MSQPHGTIMHAGSYLRTQREFSEPTLILAAKDVLYPHVGGTVTHRARCDGVSPVSRMKEWQALKFQGCLKLPTSYFKLLSYLKFWMYIKQRGWWFLSQTNFGNSAHFRFRDFLSHFEVPRIWERGIIRGEICSGCGIRGIFHNDGIEQLGGHVQGENGREEQGHFVKSCCRKPSCQKQAAKTNCQNKLLKASWCMKAA